MAESDDDLVAFKVGVASSVGFLCGVYLTVAGVLRLGFVTRYFSTAFLGGFTTATAVHIVVSQLSKLLNIKVKIYSGAGKVVKMLIDVFQNIGAANPADVVISVISVAILLLVAICINEKFKDKLRVPVPIQFFLVSIATVISHFGGLQSRFGIAVVGEVPTGIPSPSIPDIGAYPGIAYDSIMVAFLTFIISISLAKLTARIHSYEIDDNQEFVAYGLTNLLSSFFSCLTSCTAPPRAMVLSGVGARSTLHAFTCSILILIVLLVASPLFSALPVSVLAAMICVALKNILLQVTQLPFFWKTSKPDFLIWVLTCLISVFVDLDIGIIAGILISFFTVIVKNQLTSGIIGAISVNENLIHRNGNRSGVKTPEEFVIFYFPNQLFFASADKFKRDLFSLTFDPAEAAEKEAEDPQVPVNDKETSKLNSKKKSHLLLKHIILDCSAMTYIDLDGANMLKSVSSLYQKVGVAILLADCSDGFLDRIEKVGYFEINSRDTVFYDVSDALTFIQRRKDTT